MNEAIILLESKEFYDSLYGFAYKRTNNSYEAEDLCSDIILAVMKAIRRNSDIKNINAFVWTIAHRTYADFSEKRRNHKDRYIVSEYSDEVMNIWCNPIDEFLDSENDYILLKRIMGEISFLSKIYRDVCVLYYFEEMKISDISKRLDIAENTIKQRLHFSRISVKKGIEKMDTSKLLLKPIDLVYLGNGNPVGNDPRVVAERSFSKNLLYLCRDNERSVKELSELLFVPMPFVEEEIEIQLKGQNGYYGLLQKTRNNKYISNFIIVDYDDYMKVSEMYKRNAVCIAERFQAFIKGNEQRILDLPFINKQNDVQFITWALVFNIIWRFEGSVADYIEEKYFKDVIPTKRDFYTFGIAKLHKQDFNIGFYGCDGIYGMDIGGYKEVFISNIYGKRIKKHFACGHNISQDACLVLTLKTIGGLSLKDMNEEEKEIAAKAIEAGYICKVADMLYPKILVSESNQIYDDLVNEFIMEINDLIEPTAHEMHQLISNYVPKHLLGEWSLFVEQTAVGLVDSMIERCIQNGILLLPEDSTGAEGVVMVVKR